MKLGFKTFISSIALLALSGCSLAFPTGMPTSKRTTSTSESSSSDTSSSISETSSTTSSDASTSSTTSEQSSSSTSESSSASASTSEQTSTSASTSESSSSSTSEHSSTSESTSISTSESTSTSMSTSISTSELSSSSTSSSEIHHLEKTELTYTYDDFQAHSAYSNMDNCPLKGNPKLLIIPVWFTDSDTFIENKDNVRDDIELAYLGSNEDNGWRSVRTFYEEESLGELSLNGTVSEWYEPGRSYTYYASDSNRTTSLVRTAVTWYFSSHSESRSDYDYNSDGYLDGIIIIYAAPDSQSLENDSYENLWAYCSWTQSTSSVINPQVNTFFWASYDFMYDKATSLSRTEKTNYAHGNCSYANVDSHAFIHEMGHVLGAFDYYDYSDQYSPAGGFSMQDHNVGGHDPYSLLAYGWVDPYIPNESMSITINDFQSSHDVILLANHEVSDSPFDEYMLLELYTPTGLNEFDSAHQYRENYPLGPSVPGIRVWHIDARLVQWSNTLGWVSTMFTNPTKGNVYHAMVNTYAGVGRISPLGSAYVNYNLLQLIRNDTDVDYKPLNHLEESDLFYEGDVFNMSTYAKQFVTSGKMNDKKELGWSFEVTSISSNQATINLIKSETK